MLYTETSSNRGGPTFHFLKLDLCPYMQVPYYSIISSYMQILTVYSTFSILLVVADILPKKTSIFLSCTPPIVIWYHPS